MALSSYNSVLYHTRAHFEMHPDRLASVGRLCGMHPAPVDNCRYLEIGCGSGNNVISLAYYLPGSRFFGIDLAEVPIAAGKRLGQTLDLGNLTLHAGDLRQLPEDWKDFDYITAHGVYSWVPPEVSEALLHLCGERLAPSGIAFISYNALPGQYARRFVDDFMLFHTRHIAGPAEKLAESRSGAQFLCSSPGLPDAWRPLIERETKRLASLGDSWLFHDDINEFNRPVYLRDFAAAAGRYGLQYLGDAEAPTMFDPHGLLPPAVRKSLAGDRVAEAQYLDFVTARMFRQTLLCRNDVSLRPPDLGSHLEEFHYSSLTRVHENGEIEGLRGVRIKPIQDSVRYVAAALGEVYPLPLSFEELLPYAGSETALRDMLRGMIVGGFADFHLYGFPCEEAVTARPKASRLARVQAAESEVVTNACGRVVQLDEIGRALIQLLDGERDLHRIAEDLARIPDAPDLETIAKHLPDSLEWMAHAALLID